MTAAAAVSTFSLALRATTSNAVHWLAPGAELWIGRHPTNEVSIDAPTVSRFHATIRWDAEAERPVLRDVNSSNGTRVDGVQIEPQQPVVIHGGERVRFGREEYRVELVHEGVAAPALLTHDSSEVLLFSDHGPVIEDYVWNREALLRRLLKLEDERRTGTLHVTDGETEAVVVICLGTIVSARCGGLEGLKAVRALTQFGRGSVKFTRTFEPLEAEFMLSLRELLTLEQDDTRRMRRDRVEEELTEVAELVEDEAAEEPGPNGTLFTLNSGEVWGG